jgi:hypothetical protein
MPVTLPELIFLEQQRFAQWWVWLAVILISGLQWWGFVQQTILGIPFGDNPEPPWMMWLTFALFGIGLPLLMLSCRLITAVQSDALYVRFIPFHLRPLRIDYAGLRGWRAVRYSPLRDFGGWGIRCGRRGMAYNVSGSLGVELEYSSGRRLLIGSQRPQELEQAIASAAAAASAKPGPPAGRA